MGVPDSSLILDPVLFSGCHCGNLDDGRTKSIVVRLLSEVGTGAAAVSCVHLVWREGTRPLWRYCGRGGLCGKSVDFDWDKLPDPARLELVVIHNLDLV